MGRYGNPEDGQDGRRKYNSYEIATFSSGVSSFFLAFCTYASAFSFFST